MRLRGPASLLLLVVATVTACERTPVEPFDDAGIAALAGIEVHRPSSLTLPHLLYSAIRSVHAEQGTGAAHDLVRELALIQHRLDAAPVEERPELRQELRREQLRIVLLVNDREIIERTIRGVADEAAALRIRHDVLARSGVVAPEAAEILEDLPVLLARAGSAENDLEALDAATRAASRTHRMRDALAGAARLPSLDDLYEDATGRLKADAPLHRLVEESSALRAAAEDAVRSGEREQAHDAATAARHAQIRVVLAGLGPDVVADMIDWGRQRVREQAKTLAAVAAVRDVSRLERMNASAGDMLHRAERELRSGSSAAALDLAAHAVDLLNALEGTLSAR